MTADGKMIALKASKTMIIVKQMEDGSVRHECMGCGVDWREGEYAACPLCKEDQPVYRTPFRAMQ